MINMYILDCIFQLRKKPFRFVSRANIDDTSVFFIINVSNHSFA